MQTERTEIFYVDWGRAINDFPAGNGAQTIGWSIPGNKELMAKIQKEPAWLVPYITGGME